MTISAVSVIGYAKYNNNAASDILMENVKALTQIEIPDGTYCSNSYEGYYYGVIEIVGVEFFIFCVIK